MCWASVRIRFDLPAPESPATRILSLPRVRPSGWKGRGAGSATFGMTRRGVAVRRRLLPLGSADAAKGLGGRKSRAAAKALLLESDGGRSG